MLASAETNRLSEKTAFGENGFRRSAGAKNGEPKRFSTFRYTPYR